MDDLAKLKFRTVLAENVRYGFEDGRAGRPPHEHTPKTPHETVYNQAYDLGAAIRAQGERTDRLDEMEGVLIEILERLPKKAGRKLKVAA